MRFGDFITFDASNGFGREKVEVAPLQLALFPKPEQRCSKGLLTFFALKTYFFSVIAVRFIKDGVRGSLVIAQCHGTTKIGNANVREIGLGAVSGWFEKGKRHNERLAVTPNKRQRLRSRVRSHSDEECRTID